LPLLWVNNLKFIKNQAKIMKIESLRIGMKVKHPQYGIGVVKTIYEKSADILFDVGLKNIAPEIAGIQSAEPVASITGIEVPLSQFIKDVVSEVADRLNISKPDDVVQELAIRWHNGTLIIKPADPSLQSKEVPLEVFFHKIVMMRNNLRCLEQKVNASEKLTDAEKFEMQQYITRCYGSMTTFNILFKRKEDQFNT